MYMMFGNRGAASGAGSEGLSGCLASGLSAASDELDAARRGLPDSTDGSSRTAP